MGWDWPFFLGALTSAQMVRAAWTTIWVAVVAQTIGTVIGVIVAPTMLSSNVLVRAPALGYRWLFQGTPLLVQILAFFAVLPQLGVPLGIVASGLLALGINEGAKMTEIVRAGLISVDSGQRDAARSLGFNRWQVFFLVVLPQALKVIIPPLGNNFNYMLKATSLLAAISFAELLRVSQQIAQFTTRPLEVYSAASIYYLAMTSAWDSAQRRLEAWFSPTREKPGQQLWQRRIHQSDLKPHLQEFVARVTSPREPASEVPLVETCELRKHFGAHVALSGVDFAVQTGEVVAIVGPSGCGKTTLLRCLNALVASDGGAVSVSGEIIGASPDDFGRLTPISTRKMDLQRREIGFVFQRFHLFSHLTALGNVSLALRLVLGLSRKNASKRALELLSKVGLSEKADSYPHHLSGGQQQRVAIARALALEPRLMLFDEPTSALDPETVKEVLDVIRELVKDGMTIVLVTHEITFAREIADRFVFMSDGQIVEQASTKDFFEQHRDARTREFLDKLV